MLFRSVSQSRYFLDGTYCEEGDENEKLSINRSFVKTYLLKIAYGCGDKVIDEIPAIYRHPFINEYTECMRRVSLLIAEKFKPFHQINVERRKLAGKNYNYEGSTLSHLNQYVENQILMKMYTSEAIAGNKLIENNSSVLCFDGIMIDKSVFNAEFNADSFIRKCEDYFISAGLKKFKLEVKKMDEYHDMMINSIKPSYDPEFDYASKYLNFEHTKRLAKLRSYKKMFKFDTFSSITKDDREKRDIIMEEIGGFYLRDFRKKMTRH